MDFSKVRLADFVRSSLREEPPSIPEKSSIHANVDHLNHVCDLGDACARAPQYTINLAPLTSAVPAGIQYAQMDDASGYSLAVCNEGVVVWKFGSTNSLLFPLPSNHSVSAILVPPNQVLAIQQPGLVAVDRVTGSISYWESVSKAIMASGSSNLATDTNESSDTVRSSGMISLGRNEEVEVVESVHPFGLVAATNEGRFYLVNLTDDMGRREVCVSAMRSGSRFLSQLKRGGAFQRNVTSVRAGRILGDSREVYVVNKFGDLALWHVGANGISTLVNESRIGMQLHMRMNLLYPNSALSLEVHDVAVEPDMCHVLASFAPHHDLPLRYFVVVSFSSDLEVSSVYRVQAYESDSGEINNHTALHVSQNMLVIVCGDAISFVDSPTKKKSPRWEESLALKPSAELLGSSSTYAATYASAYNRRDQGVVIATAMGFLIIHLHSNEPLKSTTQARLEQAVFESRPNNPLDFTRWPSYTAYPDPSAIDKLALQIAEAHTPFLPAELPDLAVHLDLRARSLKSMFTFTEEPNVRELAQTLVASHALYVQYENCDVKSTIDKAADNTTLRSFLLTRVLETPKLLDSLAEQSISNRSSTAKSLSHILLAVLIACNCNGLGMPVWATRPNSPLRTNLEILTTQAVEANDYELLSSTVELLCAYTSTEIPEGADNNAIKTLLHQLAEMGSPENSFIGRNVAISIAANHRVYSALAPLEVEIWQNGGNISNVVEHISEFGDAYASAVFDTCISEGHSDVMISELATYYPQLIDDYLNAHKLHNIAWTLQPGTYKSTTNLGLATKEVNTLEERRVFASLYKLSAYFLNRSSDVREADATLNLVRAQELLLTQFNTEQKGSDASGASVILRRGLLSLKKLIDRNTAVDMLALAPVQPFPETNINFILGFALVDPKDLVRQRLLVQQLICNTNWDSVSKSPENTRFRKLKQTLFYHTYQHLSSEFVALLQEFRSALVAPSPQDTKLSYPWDINGAALKELTDVSLRAIDIADKYKIDAYICQICSGV